MGHPGRSNLHFLITRGAGPFPVGSRAIYISSCVDGFPLLKRLAPPLLRLWLERRGGGDAESRSGDCRQSNPRTERSHQGALPTPAFPRDTGRIWESPEVKVLTSGSSSCPSVGEATRLTWAESLSMAWRTFRSFCCCLKCDEF